MNNHILLQRILYACLVIALCILPVKANPALAAPSTAPVPQRSAPTWPPRPDPVLADLQPRQDLPQSIDTCTASWGNAYTQIVMMSYRDVKWEIYRHGACASSPVFTRLTDNSAFDGYPRLDSALARIVFVSDRGGNDDIYSMDLSGGDVRRLTADLAEDSLPAWSPDGQMIVFVSDRGGDPDLYLIDRDGSNPRLLAQLPGLDSDPSWSPDGKKITWVHWSSSTVGKIYSLALESGLSAAVTGDLSYPSRPSWSPDGRTLAYSADMNANGWIDLAWITLADSRVQWRSCYEMRYTSCDFLIGGFWPEWSHVLGSEVTYVQNGSTMYIKEAGVAKVSLSSTWSEYPMQYALLDFAPDSANTDTGTPVSRVLPLPEYSPASGFEVRVSAADPGAAGLTQAILFTKNEPSQDWSYQNFVEFPGQPAAAEASFGKMTGTPGSTLYFRSSAEDGAGHAELTGSTADTFTRLYRSSASGQVMDQRGIPLAGVRGAVNPGAMNAPVSDASGALDLYFSADGAYSAAFTRPGYMTLPPLALQPQQGKSKNFFMVLPSGSNLLENGQFEDPQGTFTNWQVSGTLSSDQAAGHTSLSASLGTQCPGSICFSPSELVSEDYASTPELAVTPDGVVHLVTNWVYGPGLVYYARSADGQWSKVGSLPPGDNAGLSLVRYTDLTLDSSGNLAMLLHLSTGQVKLLYKPLGEPWISTDTPLASTTGLKARFDNSGRLHVLYTDSLTRLYYRVWEKTGQWSAALLINEMDKAANFDLVPAPDGSIHIVYVMKYPDRRFYYTRLLANGELTVPEYTETIPSISGSKTWLFLDPEGELHLIFAISGAFLYFQRSTVGDWSQPDYPFPDQDNYTTYYHRGATMDPMGNLQIFFYGDYQYTYHLYVLRKPAGSDTFALYDLGIDPTYSYTYLFTDRSGADHMVTAPGNWTKNFYYRRQEIAAQPGSGSLSQTITLPAVMYQPTLSFLYQFEQFQQPSHSRFEIELTPQGGSPVSLLALSEQGGWKHAWADLTPWLGQTVTLTFRLNQAAGETTARARLDEVAVSAWTTLSISSVEVSAPQPVMDWWSAPVTVTVRGENFAQGILVRLGGQVIPAAWVSENELTFVIPADFHPGRHSLVLENPGGVQAAAADLIVLGHLGFLPFTTR